MSNCSFIASPSRLALKMVRSPNILGKWKLNIAHTPWCTPNASAFLGTQALHNCQNELIPSDYDFGNQTSAQPTTSRHENKHEGILCYHQLQAL
jgi:hypothetical protein